MLKSETAENSTETETAEASADQPTTRLTLAQIKCIGENYDRLLAKYSGGETQPEAA